MNTVTKLAAFSAVVAATFGGAMAVGAAVGPIDTGGNASHTMQMSTATGADERPRGLAVADAGFRLVAETNAIEAATATAFAFQILDDEGSPLTEFDELHERRLHLIVLSRNLIDYLHLHPTMDAAGRWTVDLPALKAGSYRIFADFQPAGGDNLTLGTDLVVPGTVDAPPLPASSAFDEIDGYTIELTGTPQVGDSELGFTVELDGQPVRTDPYLGAAGHLVAIRLGDLAYLHVHPHEDMGTKVVTFTGEFPTSGTYRLFFDFSHNGVVHTAAYTVIVPDGDSSSSPSPSIHDEGH